MLVRLVWDNISTFISFCLVKAETVFLISVHRIVSVSMILLLAPLRVKSHNYENKQSLVNRVFGRKCPTRHDRQETQQAEIFNDWKSLVGASKRKGERKTCKVPR